MTWVWVGLIVVGIAVLFYWQLIIAEGTYLGPKVVAWTYDLVARRYDAMKQFVTQDESWFVARPLLQALEGVESPLVLDIATGTGRLPSALLREHFRGQIVGIDLSLGMLRQARSKLQDYGEQVRLVRYDASRLPFPDGMFDAVTCMESLEFIPRPKKVLVEMVRVLAPAGILLVTNRVGGEAHLLPNRALSRSVFRQTLESLPLYSVTVQRWQVQYDLAIARKEGVEDIGDLGLWGEEDDLGQVPEAQQCVRGLESFLRCPLCGGNLERGVARLTCTDCAKEYPIREGIVHLVGV